MTNIILLILDQCYILYKKCNLHNNVRKPKKFKHQSFQTWKIFINMGIWKIISQFCHLKPDQSKISFSLDVFFLFYYKKTSWMNMNIVIKKYFLPLLLHTDLLWVHQWVYNNNYHPGCFSNFLLHLHQSWVNGCSWTFTEVSQTYDCR